MILLSLRRIPRVCRSYVSAICRVAIALLVLCAPLGGMSSPVAAAPQRVLLAQDTIFPDVPGGYNGMKISYTVTGAMLGEPQDSGISLRSYSGRLGAGTLTVSGWVEQTGGYSADLGVSVTVGDHTERFDSGGGNPWHQDFSVSVPIPAGETKGSFGILMMGDYNAGTRTLYVGADFAPNNPVAVTVSGQVYTPLTRTDSNRGFPADVRASQRAPLPAVPVDLVRLEQDAQGQQQVRKLNSTTADEKGQYAFVGVPVTTSLALSVALQSADLWVLDASASPANYNPLPSPAAPVYAISQPFAVTGDADITANVAFDRDGSFTYPPAGSALLQRLDDFGMIYYHTWQAIQLATQLGVTLDTKPLPVYGYLPDTGGAYWRGPNSAGGNAGIPPHIVFGGLTPAGGVAPSHVNNGSRPDNREWHEFGHQLMADAFANLMPNDGILPRANHAGYKNASTGDSWVEGFAEFFSLVVNREIAKDDTLPQIYHWAGNAASLEANWVSWGFRGAQSFEEFAVASLLWDLLDAVDAKDATVLTSNGAGGAQVKTTYTDLVQVDLATLWPYLLHNRGGAYGYNLHVQHLYDVLKANGAGSIVGANGLTALDELFVAHGFFVDTGANRGFYDAGEVVGTTGYLTYTVGATIIPARPQRPSPPPVPDAYVRVVVLDEAETPLTVTQFDVDVRFEAPFDIYNYSFVATATNGRLFLLPAPAHYAGTLSVTPKGMTVDTPLVLTNEFVWTAPADGDGVILSHTFHADTRTSKVAYLPLIMRQAAPIPPTASDDFCNVGSGWPDNDTDGYSLHYLAGPPCQYQIRINVDNWFAAATAMWQAADFTLESLVRLDATRVGGAGLLFGLNSDWSRFYILGIGTNGKYWLSRFEGGGWTNVTPSAATTNIDMAGENRLKLVSEGSRFTLYLNGSLLTSVDDGASHSGRVGLYAEGMTGFDARFRNVALWSQTIVSAEQSAASAEASAEGGGLPVPNFRGE